MTETERWLCPHCRCPLRFRDFQPGEQIFPCPDCGESIEILTSGKRVTGIVALPKNEAPAETTTSIKYPLFSWSGAGFSGRAASPRAVSLFVTLGLGVVLVGLYFANRPSAMPTADAKLPDQARGQPAAGTTPDEEKPVDTAGQDIEASKPHSRDEAPIMVDADDPAENEIPADEKAPPVPAIREETVPDDEIAVAEVPNPYFRTSDSSLPLTTSSSTTPNIPSEPAPQDVSPPDDSPTAEEENDPQVDVARALQTTIARWEQPQSIPLIEVLDQFEEMVGGKIAIDEFESPAVQEPLRRPVRFAHRQKTLAEILTLLLKDVGLDFEVRENTIHIAPVQP